MVCIIYLVLILQDFNSLKNGSLDYSHADDPTYRVCVEETKNTGNYIAKF